MNIAHSPPRFQALLGLAALACAVMAFVPSTASASITLTLGTPNPGISGYTGPYATVTETLVNSTTASFTFNSLSNGSNVYLMGGQGTAALNINATSFTLGAITGSNSGSNFTTSDANYSFAGAGNVDGFGSFNLTIDTKGGYKNSSDTLSFTVTNTSGTWASENDVLIANAPTGGYLAGAHIFVSATNPADGNQNTGDTGYAVNGTAVVPEPTALAAALSGLIPLGVVCLYRRRSRREGPPA